MGDRALFARAPSDYQAVVHKFSLIEHDRLKPGSRAVLTSAELNAYARREIAEVAPDGVRNARLELGPGTDRHGAHRFEQVAPRPREAARTDHGLSAGWRAPRHHHRPEPEAARGFAGTPRSPSRFSTRVCAGALAAIALLRGPCNREAASVAR